MEYNLEAFSKLVFEGTYHDLLNSKKDKIVPKWW